MCESVLMKRCLCVCESVLMKGCVCVCVGCVYVWGGGGCREGGGVFIGGGVLGVVKMGECGGVVRAAGGR